MAIPAQSFRQRFLETLLPEETRSPDSAGGWNLVRANPGLHELACNGERYRLGNQTVLNLGFSEWLLGARYSGNWDGGRHPPVDLGQQATRVLEQEAATGQFVLVLNEDIRDAATGTKVNVSSSVA